MTEHDQKHVSRGAARKAALLRALRDVLVFVLVAVLNPFGIVDWSEMRSQDFWQRINADNYPSTAFALSDTHRRTKPPAPVGRDAITLVYFDDTSVRRQYGKAGLTSFALLDLIDDIKLTPSAPPKAVFVDMILDDAGPEGLNSAELLNAALGDEKDKTSEAWRCAVRDPRQAPVSPFRCLVIRVAQLTQYKSWYHDPMCQDSTLAKLKCIRDAHGLPLIFADVSTQLQKDRRFDDLPRSAASFALGMVAALSPATIDVNAYPLVTPEQAADRQDLSFQLYPAAALYAVWCNDRCKVPPDGIDGSGRASWSSQYKKRLEVAWGIGPAISDDINDPTHLLVHRQVQGPNAKDLAERCTAAEPGRWADVKHLVKMALSGLLKEKPACLYTRAVPSDIFQSASMSRDDADKLLAGKLVIVGAQFRASTDYVSAAPFGEVPGVYLHAMALDNLIEAGPHYQQKPEMLIGHFATNDILNVIVLFVVTYILARARVEIKAVEHRAQDSAHPERPHLRRLMIILGALGYTLLFWIVILALTRFPLPGIRIIPDNINAAAAMAVALLGLLDLTLEALKPLIETIWHRAQSAMGVMIHGAPPAEAGPQVQSQGEGET